MRSVFVPRASCEACGAKLTRKSKFCPECGAPVSSGDTVVQEVPPAETGPVPIEPQVAERRFFGVPPSTILLLLTLGSIALAIALFALGSWPWALIALGLSGFVATGLIAQTRRLPGEASEVTKASLAALGSARARAGAMVETVAAHGSARIDLLRLRRESGALAADRSERLRELGEAVYEDNKQAAKELRERIEQIDGELQGKEAQMAQLTMDAQERIGRAHLQVQPTRVLDEDEQPPDQGEKPESGRNTAGE